MSPPPISDSLRLEWLDPSSLEPNGANWKHHPREQREAYNGLFGSVGYAGACLLNRRTGKLLDGHMRREEAIRRGEGALPVLVGDWDDEQERAILAHLDPTGWTAIADKSKLEALLKGPMPTIAAPELGRLMDAVRSASRMLEPGPTDPADPAEPDGRPAEELEISIPLDSIWPTDNPYSVPSLLPEMQADQVPAPITTWGIQGARRPMAGTWHFYVHDRKFEPLWRKPHRVLLSRPSAACEPNFSTTDQTPFSLNLWNTYRKRWIGRYWQACGIRLFVDLNVDSALNTPHEALGGSRMNLLGVPRGWSAYSSRAHGNNPDALVSEWGIAREHSGSDHPLFLVVGGGRRVRSLAEQYGWVWVAEQLQEAHGRPDDGPAESDPD